MTTIQITVKPNMSKQEEIDLLHKVAGCFSSEETYLSQLLTPEAVAWIETKMHDDFAPNLLDAVNFNGRQAQLLQGQLNDAQSAGSKLHQQVSDLTLGNSELKERLESAIAARTQDQEHFDKTCERMQDALDEAAMAQGMLEAHYAAEIEKRDEEIIHLKAKLWDLTQELEHLIQTTEPV